MSIFKPESRLLQRHAIADLSKVRDGMPRKEIDQIKRIVNKQDDLKIVRNHMVERYAYVIAETQNDETASTEIELQRVKNLAIADAFRYGIYEVTRSYAYERILGFNARLFPWSSWSWTTAIDEQMAAVRERGQAPIALQNSDTAACACGASLLYVSTESDRICYDDVYPDEFYYAFAPEITELGGVVRPTNTSRLDEATVIVMRLERVGAKNRWQAWYGASVEFERGRMVVYESDNWHEIPDVGDPEALDWTPARTWERGARDVANPLTLHGLTSKDANVPTYPFIILRGDPQGQGKLIPTTGVALYQTTLEFDVAASVILRSANEGSIGRRALETDKDLPPKVPRSLRDLDVILNPGQRITNIGWSPANASQAQEIVSKQIQTVAQAHHVPGFLMVTDWGQMPSGTALRTAQMEMDQYRDVRIGLNRSPIGRLWDIERAYINMGGDKIGAEVAQTWDPGEPSWPEDPLEMLTVAKGKLEAGATDIIGFTMEVLPHLDTREKVFNYRKKLAKEQEKVAETEFKKAAPAPAGPTFGLGAKVANRTIGGPPQVQTPIAEGKANE